MQVKKQKVISVSPENRKKLMARYGCSQSTVYQALRFVTNTKLAESIRQDAINVCHGVVNKKILLND